jgi:hypothetical protein
MYFYFGLLFILQIFSIRSFLILAEMERTREIAAATADARNIKSDPDFVMANGGG